MSTDQHSKTADHGHAWGPHGRMTKTCRTWQGMRKRCHDPLDKRYKDYGGRGITVCERWRDSFANFFADMGERPAGMTIDRIDNDGPYSPENCRWATNKEQHANRRNNVRITIGGRTQTLQQWCDERGVNRDAIVGRIRRGWDAALALSTPVRPQHGPKTPKICVICGNPFVYSNRKVKTCGPTCFAEIGRRNAKKRWHG